MAIPFNISQPLTPLLQMAFTLPTATPPAPRLPSKPRCPSSRRPRLPRPPSACAQPPATTSQPTTHHSPAPSPGNGTPPPPSPPPPPPPRPLLAHATSRDDSTAPPRNVDVVLTHATADFDTLASAVGVARLRGPHTAVVLPGGEHPSVKRFLALHTQMLPVAPLQSIDTARLRWVGVVDTHRRDRLGKAADWPALAQSCTVYDHHDVRDCDIVSGEVEVVAEDVGATATMVVERLRDAGYPLLASDATLMALAIHFDTGSLTFENTTARDVEALAWLMSRGANQRTVNEFTHQLLTEEQQNMLNRGLQKLRKENVKGVVVATVVLDTPSFAKGMSTVAQDLLDLSGADLLVMGVVSPAKKSSADARVSVIGRARSRAEGVDMGECFSLHGGGGHPKAASLATKLPREEVEEFVEALTAQLIAAIPEPAMAVDFMNTDVRTCSPLSSIDEAKAVMLKENVSGLVVLDADEKLRGVVTRYDVMMAEINNRSHLPVTAVITKPCRTLVAESSVDEAEQLMAQHKIGRLPVVDSEGHVLGIVTRTDVLAQRHLM